VIVTIPPDQNSLLADLSAKLDRMPDQEALAMFMGQVLRSLLRRQGDAEFLAAVQDAYIAGMADRNWAGQRQLGRDVIRVVIEIRPEIAAAWRATHGGEVPEAPLRRACDLGPPASPAVPVSPQPARPEAERLVAGFVAASLERRLQLFLPPPPRFPSPAYCHEQPFFLFSPLFVKVAAAFVTDVVMDLSRDHLERHVYRMLAAKLPAPMVDIERQLEAKRLDIWKILTEQLGKLAAHHRTAEAKVAAAQDGEGGGSAWKMVEVPVTRPRVFKVLGVAFTFGQTTAMRKVRVKDTSGEIDVDEMQALTLITRLRDMAAQEGLELPEGCDFQFLRTLLEFDARKYGQAIKEYSALAGHKETSRNYLFERLQILDKNFPNSLSDALVLMLFTQLSDQGFGFRELYDVCVGTARDASARASKRPFVQPEVARRPRELAFQLREVLRRRSAPQAVYAAAEMLLDCWRIMAKARFSHDLDSALTVLAAFPVAFAGDPEEAIFVDISHNLYRTLTAQVPDFAGCMQALSDSYRAVLARRPGEIPTN
jgi:hypothetical protein